ncbi:hypothetical protein BZM27_36245 [Paraburkholderia steynii]|uniref:HTH tetR-type domain-containing protein n=1 Tax=Paraburkholderia steynii TaxID=1245441 RepID=A0A4R0X938_9BURK|nr:hypothetical protein BZM27_36245 [Paraburkholderia steynii]
MGRSSRKQAEVTREEILDAAEVLFARDGVSAVPLTSIARHAGLTTGAVYWHFADKDELLVALFDRVHLPVSVLIPVWSTGATTGHGAERIQAFCLRLIDGFLDSPAGLRRASIFYRVIRKKCPDRADPVSDPGIARCAAQRHRARRLRT